MKVPVVGNGYRALRIHPLPAPVSAKGPMIGWGSLGPQGPIIGMDTDALGIHSPIPPVGEKGGDSILGY